MVKRKKADRPISYKKVQRGVPANKLAQVQAVAARWNADKEIESARLQLAQDCEKAGMRVVDATDQNAFDFMKKVVGTYVIHFGKHPLDILDEIEDMIGLLEDVQDEIGDYDAQHHRKFDELVAAGAGCSDVELPLNVGLYVYGEKWHMWTPRTRELIIKSLEKSHNQWNRRHGIRKRKSSKEKRAA